MSDELDTTRYVVVINDEEQYSIWPTHLERPSGWHQVGEPGDKATCLDHIERTWTDMRPRSLREAMAADLAAGSAAQQ
ncbi:MbtH family protein [Pseudonocardia sp. TRM90224]|uniref:MbtH family protein n=1 Tax=Pseudonocardia sp. TRM90224 TaxID=2812678 RepID=UPI001E2CC19C|nr:MbtH family protein [Pseudonocardia sp. TRM90224]